MSNLIYSINATLPIFLLIILGKVLKTTKIINDEFTKTADRYVFRIALPALLFSDLTENNVGSAFDGKYVLFCFSVTIFSIAVLWGLTEKFMKNEEIMKKFKKREEIYLPLSFSILSLNHNLYRYMFGPNSV